jgi:hypothetical protein
MTVDLTCPYCRFTKKVPKNKIPAGVKWATCPSCRQRFEIPAFDPETPRPVIHKIEPKTAFEEPGEKTEKESKRRGAPWENRSELGLWQAIYQTFKVVLFSPKTLFSSLTFEGGFWEPLAFAILVGSIVTMFSLFFLLLVQSAWMLSFGPPILGQFTIGLVFLFTIAIVPVFWAVMVFASSGILHLFLLIVGAGENGYEATFRVISYSQATQVWGLIPIIGGFIGSIWLVVVQIIGLREIHETSYLRIIIAVLMPLILFVFLFVMVLIALFALVQQ